MTHMTIPVDGEWTAVTLRARDRDPIPEALTRLWGGTWRMRSGVVRRWEAGRLMSEWQLDEGSWLAWTAADRQGRDYPTTVYVKPGLVGGMPREALAVAR